MKFSKMMQCLDKFIEHEVKKESKILDHQLRLKHGYYEINKKFIAMRDSLAASSDQT